MKDNKYKLYFLGYEYLAYNLIENLEILGIIFHDLFKEYSC